RGARFDQCAKGNAEPDQTCPEAATPSGKMSPYKCNSAIQEQFQLSRTGRGHTNRVNHFCVRSNGARFAQEIPRPQTKIRIFSIHEISLIESVQNLPVDGTNEEKTSGNNFNL